MDRIKIFLTNLGCYNEDIREGYEEYFITGYESSIANLEIGEFTSVSEVNELDDFDLIPEIEDEEALGKSYAGECCILNGLPETVQHYCSLKTENHGSTIFLIPLCASLS